MLEKITENWELFLSVIISICAFVAVFLSAPTDTSSSIYKMIYNIINYLAFNIGKAENADDADKK